MKRKLTILLFSILISISSYGEWTEVTKNLTSFIDKPLWTKAVLGSNSEVYYLDLHSMKKRKDGYVYYSVLVDLPKADKDGHRGWKLSVQGDCNLSRGKSLTEVHYTIPTKLVKLPPPSSGLIETDETYIGPSTEIAPTNKWVSLNNKSAFGNILDWTCMMKDTM